MKELRDQLWDYVYGLLEEADAARLRARITSDRQTAREYARVKLQSELVGEAARANQAERDLPSLAERPGKAAARDRSAARWAVFVGSLALSLGLLLYAGASYWSGQSVLHGPTVAERLEEFERSNPRLIVTGPDELQPDAANTYEVRVETVGGEALEAAPIEASLEDRSGQTVWRETARTDTDGKLRLQPDSTLSDDAYFLNIRVASVPDLEDSQSNQGIAINGAAQLSTWLPVNEQTGGDIVLENRIASGDRTYFRRAELRTAGSSAGSRTPEWLVRNLQKKDSAGGHDRRMASEVLWDEAKRVRWGVENAANRTTIDAYPLPSPPTEGGALNTPHWRESNVDFAEQSRDLGTARSQQPMQGAESLAADAPRKELEAKKPAPSPGRPGEEAAEQDGVQSSPSRLERRELLLGEKEPQAGKQVLVESITAGDELIESRVIDGAASNESLQQRIDDLRRQGKIDPKFSGRARALLYDAAVAPPQKVAEASVDIPPMIERLHCAVRFDRNEYYAGELVEVELKVTDDAGQPLPAVLNVQVDAIPLHEADADTPPQVAADLLFTSSESPRVPLVFDNAAEQTQRVDESFSAWLAKQQQSRRYTALWLLAGSVAGLCLLAVAWPLKWLPKARYWLPVAALLTGSAILGLFWLRGEQTTVTQARPERPLTTFGVRAQPPERRLTRDHFTARRENLSFEDSTPTEAPQSLWAIADWDRLALGPSAGAENELLWEPATILRLKSVQTGELSGQIEGGTIFWHPRVTTDDLGACRFAFAAPASELAHRLIVLAHCDGKFGVTTRTIPLVVGCSGGD